MLPDGSMVAMALLGGCVLLDGCMVVMALLGEWVCYLMVLWLSWHYWVGVCNLMVSMVVMALLGEWVCVT